jgi:ATP-dependent helicase/nuclease subunit A
VHAFLAADRVNHHHDVRLERGRRLLDACRSGARLQPESLLGASDALSAFVATRWPAAIWHREISIRVRVGSDGAERRLSGSIDLLIETDAGFVVIDHKTFGNPTEQAVRERAEQYLPQLAAYGAAIAALRGKRVLEYWLHFGVGGVCVQCLPAPVALTAPPPTGD